jgi:hypothetical protein
MQLSPNSQIPVSYTASIPNDVTVYFVQAVLRDTQSGTILQTLNLTNVSTTPNRYQGSFKPVSDPSGLGRAVDITISVYTDSGHTTLSQNYQILQLTYTILQPWIQNLGMGGGLNIDYDKLQQMFDGGKINNTEIGNEVARKVKRTKVDYDKIQETVSGASEKSRVSLSTEFKGHVDRLEKLLSEFSRQSETNSKGHTDKFSNLEERLNKIDSKIGEGNDLSSKERTSIRSELTKMLADAKTVMERSSGANSKKIETKIQEVMAEISDSLRDELGGKEITMSYGAMQPQKKEKEKKPLFSPEDISSLLR